MALKSRGFDDLLHFAAASRTRATVTLAAVSFAVCHLLVMGTGSAAISGTADLGPDIPLQLIHFVAELCRFVLPLGVMVVGLVHTRAKHSSLH
jgi:hypothetical protein